MSAARAAGRAGDVWRLERDDHPACLGDLGREAPEEIYGLGDPGVVAGLDPGVAVTIVGSRRASPYGLRIAEQLGHDLAAAGGVVISGMAWGIDSAAHRGALRAGGATVAVLAGGPDVVYPRSGARLYREILASGAAISERPPGTQPERWSFLVRNRIMAALAALTVVVEAADPSGSLVTARIALEDLGREVGAVPGQVGMRTAAGTNRLLSEGAALIRSAEDVVDRLAGVGAATIRVAEAPALDPELERALELVEAGCATADALAREAGIEAAQAAVALTRLELLGYATSDPSGLYRRSAQASGR